MRAATVRRASLGAMHDDTRVPKRARDHLATPGTRSVLAGSAVGGAAAYAFQILGTRALGDVAYAPISVLWTIQYLALTVGLYSVESYVTRQETVAGHRSSPVLAGWVALLAGIVGLGTWATREALFHSPSWAFPLAAAASVACFGGFVVVRGALAGRYRFGWYGVATGAESAGRLALGAVVVASAPRADLLGLTLPSGALLVGLWWLAWGRMLSRARPPADAAAPSRDASAATYLGATTIANVCSQVLLAAGPLVVIPLGAGPALTSVVFVTTTAARAPLVFAFGGLLARILPPLVRAARAGEADRLQRIGLRIGVGAAAVGAVAAAAGAVAGPVLVAALFGPEFRPSSLFAGLTGAGVTVGTAALGLNQLLIAMGAERRLVLPWASGLLAGAAAVVLVDADPSVRVAAGTLVGQAVAVAGLVGSLGRAARDPRVADAALSAAPAGALAAPLAGVDDLPDLRVERPSREGTATAVRHDHARRAPAGGRPTRRLA